MKSYAFVIFAIAVAVTRGVPFASNVESNEVHNTEPADFATELNNCALESDVESITNCATERIVRSLDTLSARANIDIIPGVSLLSDSTISNFRTGKQLNDDLEKIKTGDASALELLGNATARLFSGRTLKIKLPTAEDLGRALQQSGGNSRRRKGNKKGNNMSMGILGIAGTTVAALVPLFLGKIALIAAKALIVGKIALILGAILLFQSFRGNQRQQNNHVSSVESGWSSPQTAYGPPSNSYGPPATSYGSPSSQYPYSRSFNAAEDQTKYSQELAYAAQKK